jgi:hypothetical protein
MNCPPDTCPFCLTACTALNNKPPAVGAVTVCRKCAAVLIYGPGLKLRAPTPAEAAAGRVG